MVSVLSLGLWWSLFVAASWGGICFQQNFRLLQQIAVKEVVKESGLSGI